MFFSLVLECELDIEHNSSTITTKRCNTGELGYDGLIGTRKIGPSYAKSVVYI